MTKERRDAQARGEGKHR